MPSGAISLTLTGAPNGVSPPTAPSTSQRIRTPSLSSTTVTIRRRCPLRRTSTELHTRPLPSLRSQCRSVEAHVGQSRQVRNTMVEHQVPRWKRSSRTLDGGPMGACR